MRIIVSALITLMALTAMAQEERPTINPTATYISSDGKEEVSTNYSGSAPQLARFEANAENVEGWTEYYEWRFTLEGDNQTEPYLIRYEKDTEYTFVQAGSHKIVLYAVFTQGNDSVVFTEQYWKEEKDPLIVTISESKLEMPNAFSPNGDKHNDIYGAKSGYQSLVEFKATIYNRWGQKMYEWDDPAGGWDGTFNGHDAPQGTYFVLVRAMGADGRKYTIKRDVNLLRGSRESQSNNTTTP